MADVLLALNPNSDTKGKTHCKLYDSILPRGPLAKCQLTQHRTSLKVVRLASSVLKSIPMYELRRKSAETGGSVEWKKLWANPVK